MATQAMSVEALPQPGTAPTTFDHLLPTGRERTLAATVIGLAHQARAVHVSNALLRTAGDQGTIDHERRVTVAAVIIGSRLGYGFTTLLPMAIGSLTHDIGKADPQIQPIIHSPISLRDPNTDESTKKRFRRAQERHTDLGAAMLSRLMWGNQAHQAMAVELAGGHHYFKPNPYGIPPEEFVEETQVVAAADMLDATASPRAYKPAFDHETVVEEVTGEFQGAPHILEACFPEPSARRQAVL